MKEEFKNSIYYKKKMEEMRLNKLMGRIKKKAKGPNPLSVKRKRKNYYDNNNENNLEESNNPQQTLDEAEKKKRKRHKKKKTDPTNNINI
jgi:hypothetical protein